MVPPYPEAQPVGNQTPLTLQTHLVCQVFQIPYPPVTHVVTTSEVPQSLNRDPVSRLDPESNRVRAAPTCGCTESGLEATVTHPVWISVGAAGAALRVGVVIPSSTQPSEPRREPADHKRQKMEVALFGVSLKLCIFFKKKLEVY